MSLSYKATDWKEPIYWLAKVNLKTISHLTGAQIAALNMATVPKGKVYRCTTTGNGYIAGDFYMINGGANAFKVVYGQFKHVLATSLEDTIVFNEPFPRTFMFKLNVNGGGTITNDDSSGGITLASNAVTAGRCMARLSGDCAAFDFGRVGVLKFRMQFSDAKQVRARVGVNTDNYDNVQGSSKHFALEIDNATDTDSFWWITTSDGTLRSILVTPNLPVTSNNTFRYILQHTPGQKCELWVNGILTSTKTNNIPASGGATNYCFVALVNTKENNNKTIDLRQLMIASANNDNY